MENATKALLIAASVLIVILLITLGVGIFTSAEEQMGNADLSEYQVQQFNDKFKKYEGEQVSGSDVNALIDTVFNHNNQQEDTSTCIKVSGATSIKASNTITKSPKKVSTANKYKVVATYSKTTKLITSIKITTVE